MSQWVDRWRREWEGFVGQTIWDTWSGVIPSLILNWEQCDPGSLTVSGRWQSTNANFCKLDKTEVTLTTLTHNLIGHPQLGYPHILRLLFMGYFTSVSNESEITIVRTKLESPVVFLYCLHTIDHIVQILLFQWRTRQGNFCRYMVVCTQFNWLLSQ